MGMYAHYYRLSTFELQRILDEPAAADALLGYDFDEDDEDGYDAYFELRRTKQAQGRYLDIEKAWHALHFLLTGDASFDGKDVTTSLRFVVCGGAEVKVGAEETPVYTVTARQVQETSKALRGIARSDLLPRLQADAFNAANLYPAGEWTQEGFEYLLDIYDQVAAFYHEAALHGDAILIHIS